MHSVESVFGEYRNNLLNNKIVETYNTIIMFLIPYEHFVYNTF